MIRTILFFAQFWLTLFLTLPFCLAFLVLKLVGLHRSFRLPLQWIVRTWARALAATAGTEVEAEGLERIPRTGPVCIVANHQGYMDILLVLALVRRPVGFVTKIEAVLLPVLDLWILALDSVYLDRKSLAAGKRSIEKAARKIAGGSAILVFPEGTRSRGKPIGPFRHGSFKLATKAGAIVVPLRIEGTAAAWEAEGRIRPARVRFSVLEPIPTAAMSNEERRALPERVRALIAGAE